MKNLTLIILFFGFQFAVAQKVAYIEVDKILEKMPAYEQANEAIDAQVKKWDAEMDNKFQSIESMYQEYVQNQAYLTDEVKQQKQEAIIQAENKANEFKEEKYGQEGELNKLQEEKLKPLYDLIYEAAEATARENGYDYLFDKSSETNWIYTNTAHNLTDKVIQKLEL